MIILIKPEGDTLHFGSADTDITRLWPKLETISIQDLLRLWDGELMDGWMIQMVWWSKVPLLQFFEHQWYENKSLGMFICQSILHDISKIADWRSLGKQRRRNAKLHYRYHEI